MARQRRRGNRTGAGAKPRLKIQPPRKPRIALIGFRGVGKSAIARRLSEYWQMPLVSLDETIERRAGKKIEDIVKTNGWAHFRDLEFQELTEAAKLDRVLLDCGGGIVEEADGVPSERKLQVLSAAFFCIYISTSEEKLMQRLRSLSRNASRPDLPQADSPESLMAVFRRREPQYLKVAHMVVDISDTNIAESAFRITQMFK